MSVATHEVEQRERPRGYSEVTLLQMPADAPFTIESVGSGAGSIVIAGKVGWAVGAAQISSSAPR